MNLSAQERAIKMKHILRRERDSLAEFVIELAEFDRHRQFLQMGFRSLWDFCRRELGLSETQTHYRIAAARQIQKNPALADPIRCGRLCITTLARLAKVITEQNCSQLVEEAAGKPKREVERIVARLDPKPVPENVINVPVPGKVVAATQTEILTESFARKHITVDGEYEDLLEQARDALSHKMPGAAELDILKEGLRQIIKQAQKRKGMVAKPRADKPATDGDITQSVRRTVWKRDDGRCQWRTDDGGICGSTYQIEFHHKQDRARGGLGSAENVILLCAPHHLHATEIAWGGEFIDRFRKRTRANATEDPHPLLDST